MLWAALLDHLADGEWHSGEKLAQAANMSRASVWQAVNKLEDMGLEVFAVRGKGYRLRQPLDALSTSRVRAAAELPLSTMVIECQKYSESTNAELLTRDNLGLPIALLAEYQSAGRGRRGRVWQQPYASGLCMSLGMDGGPDASELSLLPLAVGVEMAESMRALGFGDIGLKWPNDLYWKQQKLGGILIEHRGELAGRSRTVIGVGLNILSAPDNLGDGAVTAACLQQAWSGDNEMPSRAVIAGHLVRAVWTAIQGIVSGSHLDQRSSTLKRWRSLDVLAEQPIRVIQGDETFDAEYLGVQNDGAIVVRETGGKRERRSLHSADVSIRPAA